jgi:hypothetical protein
VISLPDAVPNPRCRTRALRYRIAVVVMIAFGTSAISFSARAQQFKPQEYQVQAAYLFNFGKFVNWPATSAKDGPFAICVLGRDQFGEVLDSTIARETIGDQKLVARRIANSRDAIGCRILFISSSEAPRTKEILTSLNKAAILTVSDMQDFTAEGGMIQFVLRENKVRFEVNLAVAQEAMLTLSSQLLKVAVEVRNGPGSENTNP